MPERNANEQCRKRGTEGVCVHGRNRRDRVEGEKEKNNEKRRQINLIVTLASATAISKVPTVSILAAITGIPL